MYKVLIVDDEPMIREGLRTILPWEQYGFEVVGTAANGNEALALFKRLDPSLMIIDIRMPGMNGLQLIEAVRKESMPATPHFLILSGHADFDYARQAIACRVDDYLLKPVEEEELAEKLKQLGQVLDEETDSVHRTAETEQWRKETFIRSIVFGESGCDTESLQEKARINRLLWSKYQVVLIGMNEAADSDVTAAAKLKEQLANRLEEKGIVFHAGPYIGILFKEPLGNEQIRNNLYRELEKINSRYDEDFVCAAGKVVRDVAEIRWSFNEAMELLKRRFFLVSGEILTADTNEWIPSHPDKAEEGPPDLESSVSNLVHAIEIGSEETTRRLITDWTARMVQADYCEKKIKSSLAQIISGALAKLSQSDLSLQVGELKYTEALNEMHQQRNLAALLEHAVSMLEGLVRQASVGTDSLLKKLVDLVQRNYNENLKLEGLSEVFNYNSAYLGKLFKQHTGEYFNTYLDQVRIRQSKKLLKQGLKVYQVAERVGYSSVDYFYSKFKKYEGVSPAEFRKQFK